MYFTHKPCNKQDNVEWYSRYREITPTGWMVPYLVTLFGQKYLCLEISTLSDIIKYLKIPCLCPGCFSFYTSMCTCPFCSHSAVLLVVTVTACILVLILPVWHKVSSLWRWPLPPATALVSVEHSFLYSCYSGIPTINLPRRLLLAKLLVGVVVLDVVVEQTRLPEWLWAASCGTLEGVVVQLDGEDRGRLVLYHSVHWERDRVCVFLGCSVLSLRATILPGSKHRFTKSHFVVFAHYWTHTHSCCGCVCVLNLDIDYIRWICLQQ